MIIKCKECGTLLEVDESLYEKGASYTTICSLCGTKVSFTVNKEAVQETDLKQALETDYRSNHEADANNNGPETLVNCSECGYAVSDKASKCPKCGCPVQQKQMQQLVSEHQGGFQVPSKSYPQRNNDKRGLIPDDNQNGTATKRGYNKFIFLILILLVLGGIITYLLLRPSMSDSLAESMDAIDATAETGTSSRQKDEGERSGNRGLTFNVGDVSFCLKYVEGGTFIMGATDEQAEYAEKEEFPAHSVTLHDYYLGETEVTQELWEEVMGYNPANTIGASLPMENVSWNDCADFIRELNNRTGKTFRLPTEAEWEYAARGGIYSRQCVHSGSDNAEEVGWVKSNCNGSTHPVGTRNPNELGIYDMTGNVCEWCQDWMSNYNSTDQVNPVGPNSGTARVGRGGGWCNSSLKNRVSTRFAGKTTYRDYNLGFRIAM